MEIIFESQAGVDNEHYDPAYDNDMFTGVVEGEPDYRNSCPLDVHLWSDDKEVVNCVDAMCKVLEYQTSKARKHMKVVLLNLYRSYITDSAMWVGYSRNSSAYQIHRRYNPQAIKYDVLTNVVEKLLQQDYIEHKKGFNDRVSGRGFQSRMRATVKLMEHLSSFGVKSYMIRRHDMEELIIFKNQDKEIIPYKDSRRTETMRTLMKRYNELLARTYIDVDDEAETLGKEYDIDLSRKLVKRIFNNSDWKQGGRFYNAWWMGCPKLLRRHIIIDRHPAIEYDYSGIHIHLLYAREGINYAAKGEDAYTIPGFQDRTLNKLLLLIAINAGNLTKCKQALRDKIRDDPGSFKNPEVDIDALIEAFKAKHAPISKYFFSGIGINLQHLDSLITDRIVRTFTNKGLPLLTIHDSFICRNLDAELLKSSMIEAYKYHVKLPMELEPEELDILYLYDEQEQVNINIKDESIATNHGEHTDIEAITLNKQGIRQLYWMESSNTTMYCRLSNNNKVDYDTSDVINEQEVHMLKELLQ